MLTPWDESERKPLAESFNTGPNGLAMRLFSSRGREETYSLVNPGPPFANARFLNSVQIFCNCVDWREHEEMTPKPSFYEGFPHYIQALKHTFHGVHMFCIYTRVKTSTCISLGPNTLINLSSLFQTSRMFG